MPKWKTSFNSSLECKCLTHEQKKNVHKLIELNCNLRSLNTCTKFNSNRKTNLTPFTTNFVSVDFSAYHRIVCAIHFPGVYE